MHPVKNGGITNAIQLRDIGLKTLRGQRGRVRAGKIAGGNSYGYDVLPGTMVNGKEEFGERAINTEEARVVQRIFEDYARGLSPCKIAAALNLEGVPGPRGGAWGTSTIHGNRERGTGILNNELYIGRMVWNRLHYSKDPDTRKRGSKLNPKDCVMTVEVPHLRIIDQDLWEAVKARQGGQRKTLATAAPVALRRKKYLQSGLVRCGLCGGNMTVAGAGDRRAYYCANAKEKGPAVCKGQPGLRLDRLEPALLEGLRDELMTPEALDRFRANFRAKMAEADRNRQDTEAQLLRALAKAQKAIDGSLRAIAADHATESVYAMLKDAEERKATLTDDLAALGSTAPEIALDIADLYRAQIDSLSETLSDPSIVHRASEILAELIDRITIRHDAELGHTLEIEGKLLELLRVADDVAPNFYPA